MIPLSCLCEGIWQFVWPIQFSLAWINKHKKCNNWNTPFLSLSLSPPLFLSFTLSYQVQKSQGTRKPWDVPRLPNPSPSFEWLQLLPWLHHPDRQCSLSVGPPEDIFSSLLTSLAISFLQPTKQNKQTKQKQYHLMYTLTCYKLTLVVYSSKRALIVSLVQ